MRVTEQGVVRREAIAAAAASEERCGSMPAERVAAGRARAEAIAMPTPVIAIVPVMPIAPVMPVAAMATMAVVVIPVVMSDSDGTKAERRFAPRIPARSAAALDSETRLRRPPV